ncbi:MAG: RdgB/HAM1 family non-canonical purine NTP pyrophosphatase [Pseudomonadota bacterium]|nr:RdgB/HAM1 family non-canonical purine NTP pyrophosphatase [Pseudomonadota bacterium]MEC7237232.1 RdgB/HAM1 family non-canonical purine NTP pyrophosphatase [Pseudomonadota bacterium]
MADQHRIFTESELVLASHNKGKLREIAALFAGRPFTVSSAADHDVPEPDETEDSFVGNALLKARHTVAVTGKPAIADDSGLVVPALNGAPGIYSARWAGPNRDFIMAMQKVNSSLAATGGANRQAHFICVLALAWPDGHSELFEGRVEGELVWPPRGDRGFGYDPMFVAAGHDLTFGEMDPQEKLDIGHRADAFAKLVAACFP